MAAKYEQTAARFVMDDGSITAATLYAAGNISLIRGSIRRVRFAISNTGTGSAGSFTPRLYVSKNGGAYSAVTTSSAGVKLTPSAYVTDPTSVTTQRVGNVATFVYGQFDSNGTTSAISLGPGTGTEVEFCIQTVDADLVAGDTLDFQVRNSASPLNTYTVTPRITTTVPLAVSIPKGTLAITGKAPVAVTAYQDVPVSRRTLSISGKSVTVVPNPAQDVSVPKGVMSFTGTVPVISLYTPISEGQTVSSGSAFGSTSFGSGVFGSAEGESAPPDEGSWVSSGSSFGGASFGGATFGPNVAQPSAGDIPVGVGSIRFTGTVPVVIRPEADVIIPKASLSITGHAPAVVVNPPQDVAVPRGTLRVTGTVPVVVVNAAQSVSVPKATLAITGTVPVAVTNISSVTVPRGVMAITGYPPVVAVNQPQNVTVPRRTLSITGRVPTVVVNAAKDIAVPKATLTITGTVPTVQLFGGVGALAVPVGQLRFTGTVPVVVVNEPQDVAVPCGTLAFTGHAPAVETYSAIPAIDVSVPRGTVTFYGHAPTVVVNAPLDVFVPHGRLRVVGRPVIVHIWGESTETGIGRVMLPALNGAPRIIPTINAAPRELRRIQ